MKFLLLTLVILSTSAMAADSKKSTTNTMTEMGKIDKKTLEVTPTDSKKEMADETALYAKPQDVKVNFSCKTKDGHEVKQGEKGYEECLQKVKNDKNNPHDPNADLKVNFGK